MTSALIRPPSGTLSFRFDTNNGVGSQKQSQELQQPSFTAASSSGRVVVRPTTILRPALDLLALATVLLPFQRWYRGDALNHPNPFERAEMGWAAAIARGFWIIWLTHAAGFMDEALRMFLGIRLTMGLGTPASVEKVYSKMSRWAEVVVEVRMDLLRSVCFTKTQRHARPIILTEEVWLVGLLCFVCGGVLVAPLLFCAVPHCLYRGVKFVAPPLHRVLQPLSSPLNARFGL